jgi:basic membrane protein A
MNSQRFLPVRLLGVLVLIGASCGDGGGAATTSLPVTTAAPTTSTVPSTTTTTTSAPTTTTVPVSQICQVAGVGGVADGSVAQLVWEGLGRARDQLDVEILFRASDLAGYGASIDAFVEQGCDLIVTVGSEAEAATAAAACDRAEQPFVIVGAAPAAGVGSAWADAGGTLRCDFSNVRGITFATEEAAFLTGYLAAGMAESRRVGTFGRADVEPVTVLMDAFAAGAQHYGASRGVTIQVLGWDSDDPTAALFTGADDLEQAGVIVESLAGAGVDVVFSAAGEQARSGVTVAAEEGILVIGGAADSFLTDPEFADVWLTSLVENADAAVYEVAVGVLEGGGRADSYVADLANGGVGLLPYRLLETEVPVDLADAVDELAAEIVAAGGLDAFLAPAEEG